MVLYKCINCNFTTQLLPNYNRHLKTQKHLKNEKNEQKMSKMSKKKNDNITEQIEETVSDHSFFTHLNCQFCGKNFSRNFNLQRHISVCKLNISSQKVLKDPQGSKNEQKKNEFTCQYCQNIYQTKRGLNKHVSKCQIRHFENQNLKKELEHQKKTVEIVSKMKPSQVTNNITNNNNKTINYLNSNFGEMIEMNKFLYNLQHTEQLTHHEREMLLMAYKDNGIELFARSFSHIMKENCRRQLLKEGLPDYPMLPLYCSDGNLRSHKEKDSKGWKTRYDNQSINTMINISSDQVYQSHHHPLFIDGRGRKKVFKQVKQDNHSEKIEGGLLVLDDEDN